MYKVLMIGPGRDVRGGITSVVNAYYLQGIEGEVDVKYIPTMEDGSKLRKLYIAVKAYFQFYFQIKEYDILHVHMAAQASFYRKYAFIKQAKRKNKKIIIHNHAADFDDFFYNQSNDSERSKIIKCFEIADKVVVLSKEWANFFSKTICSKEKIEILHNGIIVPSYIKKDYANNNVLFLGRLGGRKGIYDLLKIIPNIITEIPDVRFYIGGDGEIEKCEKYAIDTGCAHCIEFTGWLNPEQKAKYLEKCSIFVLPSYNEGMPMALLEAMGYGLASISTNVGGIPQVIDNKKDGIIINPGNTNQLYHELLILLENKALKEKLGCLARKKICENYTIQSNLKQLLAIYKSLTSME
ncbi:MAG: glycosyltransferase family 4 protein [Suipraeoptans sp.]